MKTRRLTWFAIGLFSFVILFVPSIWAGDFFGGGVVVARPGFGRGCLPLRRGGHIGMGVGRAGHLGYYGGYYLAPSREPDLPSPSLYDFDVKPAGRLQISVQPQDAQVFVDGLQLQPSANALFDIGLLVGSHTIQVVKTGYRPYASNIVVETAKTTAISVDLVRE
jgi:hypothetical protein